MRALAGVVALALLLMTTVPAEAHPFPKTEKVAREIVRDTLADTDAGGEKMLKLAQKLVRQAKRAADGLGVPPLPALPETTTGALEIRATLVQPGVRGHDFLLGAMWLGASEDHWTGAYWIETDMGGSVFPNLIDLNENGVLMYVDGGGLVAGDSVDVTYHFLGFDGVHTVHPLGEIPMFSDMPVLDRVDIGGAHASARGEEPEALLITPWNLFDHRVTMGITLSSEHGTLDDITIAGCADFEATQTEPGCRLLYVVPFGAALSSVSVWYLNAEGERVVDRELTRGELLAGTTFGSLG